MRQALRELLSDRDAITSRSQRIKLKLASAAVKTTTRIGRMGPAEGSVLSHHAQQMRDQHIQQGSMREESIQAVLAALSARIDELEGEEGSPMSSAISPSPQMQSPVPMVRKWRSSEAMLQRASSASSPGSGRLSARNAPPALVGGGRGHSSSCSSSAGSSAFYSASSLDSIGDDDDADEAVPASAASPRTASPPPRASSAAGSAAPAAATATGAAATPGAEAPAAATEEAEEETVQALDEATLRLMGELVGTWRNIKTNNLEAFLKHMGVGWAKRKIALAFKPEPSYAVVDGVLQVLMPSPIGERLERFPLDADERDTDPNGKPFFKRSWWEGDALTTRAFDPTGKISDTMTTRRLDADGQLVQTTTNGGVTYERIFARKADK